MHPSQRLSGLKSKHLMGRRIVLAVTGSIAAVESVRIAHELIRHGAEVFPVMTRSATALVGPQALEYATGHPPVVELTGRGEHVALCGGGKGSADLLLVAPATANTIAKIALGIDDTAVTSCATVALGAKVPLVVAPAMHEVMGENEAVRDRLRDLRKLGVHIVEPRREEEKAKIAAPEAIADAVIHRLASGAWTGREVLIISGSSAEPLDPIRVLTNRSSGRMGVALATAAYRRGAHVELWNAWGLAPLPDFARVRRFESVGDLDGLVAKTDLSRFDVILVPAALGDFAPAASREKISSERGAFQVPLKPLPKILPKIRKKARDTVLVGFKAESDARRLLLRAKARLKETGADLFVANTTAAFSAEHAEAWLVGTSGRPKRVRGDKASVADAILDAVEAGLSRGRA